MPLKDKLNGYLRQSRKFFGIPEMLESSPDVGILGIPYDLTSSHTPGARFGPDAIRMATDSERSHSYPLNLTDTYQEWNRALTSSLTIEDLGDLEVGVQLPESVSYHISEASSILAKTNCNLLFLGGDHFITYPIMKGLSNGGIGKIGLVYLDAHADYYDDMGGMTLSHASTVKRIISENLVPVEHFVGYDLRCSTPDQRNELGNDSCPVNLEALSQTVQRIAEGVDHIYISVDLDVLQPQIVPGVSHPESGGLSVTDLVEIIDLCFATKKVRIADVVEMNPLLDKNRITEIAARDIVKAILTGFAYHK